MPTHRDCHVAPLLAMTETIPAKAGIQKKKQGYCRHFLQGKMGMVMIKALQNIVDDIDEKAEHVQMSFSEDKWLEKIPSKPGWYLIKTDAPINILSDDKLLRPRYKAHINIPKTIKETLQLRDIAIIQSGNKQYVIYSGEAKSLRARAREHIKGHEKTYCLGLNAYDSLKEHDWIFCYVTLSNYPNFLNLNGDNKLLRLAVEQAWRAKNGWPILCKK